MTVDVTMTLDDKYTRESGRIYLTGIQALVRLPMLQAERDRAAGLNTAGFVSGYRGSPLGAIDHEMARARRHLEARNVLFKPGVNEDLAATAVWGTQQVGLFPGARHDGVFAYWYGKGPGVDRSCDVLRHGNMAGTARHGGVLVLAGDDHGAKSSTVAYQTEYAFMDLMIPVLHPASVQEVLDYGLIGIAMSRYSGCWVAMKCLNEVMDASAAVDLHPERLPLRVPDDFIMPEDGVHIRWPDTALAAEYRLMKHKLYAALAFARANRLNRVVIDSPTPRLGIVTTGKSYLDVRQALDDLGIDDRLAAEIGIRLYKVGMPWPLEREGVRAFAEGLDEIVVIEEKRALIENQLKEQLYNWREDVRPRVVGKFDEAGAWIQPSAGELTPARIARVIAERIQKTVTSAAIADRLAFLEAKEAALATPKVALKRVPYFCAGCPHNTSTKVPEGSRATGGIGCHYMVTWMDRSTATFTHMGGEGVPWIGQAPFTDETHIFANLGDGTYYHSGIMAIRAAVAAGVNITYKILFNDAVAMTGGQKVDGPLDVPSLTHQVYAEGVAKIVVVADDPDKYPADAGFAPGVTVRGRDDLDAVQRELRAIPGTTILVYDQVCAAEKRRRRKRGRLADPDVRVFINDLVCEGCGDCGVASNCVAVVPLETEFGRKRAIDQSACNKDLSCVNGFCPSFVTVSGATPRRSAGGAAEAAGDRFAALPEPVLPDDRTPYDVVITGIGGTGVVTISALLGMAAHLEGKGVSVLDQTGLAQKNGAVVSHVRICSDPELIHASRIAAGNARLVIGADMLTAASFDTLAKMREGHTRAVINGHQIMPADFTAKPDLVFPDSPAHAAITEAVGASGVEFLDATAIAGGLMGDSIATNLFLVGYAWQKGLLPLSREAIERAVELNGTAVAFNLAAFLWGRRAAVDLARVQAVAAPAAATSLAHLQPAATLDAVVARRAAYLTDYQDAAYAGRYRALVERVAAAEAACLPGTSALAEAVARAWFKLLAIKDEYEVARLYSDGRFTESLRAQFTGESLKLTFHLAPPLLGKRDPLSGRLVKTTFGPWMMGVFKLLARLKGLRGGMFDPFARTAERRLQRRLIADYEALVATVLAGLRPDTHAVAVELLALPLAMRGFGHVLEQNVAEAKVREADLLAAFTRPAPLATAAE